MSDDYEYTSTEGEPRYTGPVEEEVQWVGSGYQEPYRPEPYSPPRWKLPPIFGDAICAAIVYGLAVWIGSEFNIYYAPEVRIPWDIFYYLTYTSWVVGYVCNERSDDDS